MKPEQDTVKNACIGVAGDSNMADKTNKYFIFFKERVLIRKDVQDIQPFSQDWPLFEQLAAAILPIGKTPDSGTFAVELAKEPDLGEDFALVSLRSLVGRVDDHIFNLWGKASQLLNWQKMHRFCGSCGRKTEDHESEQAKVCPTCSLTWYPRISPCIIVLVTRGQELLLARSPRFTEGMYSTLAGFIEPGESVESTLRREITEEVSITIKNIRYFGSQPWPFPGQLMLGFFAEYDSGEIRIDGEEIVDAAWYHYTDLPMIPSEGTIAGQLIRHHVATLNKA
jgi:NAD+ diphosphatase